MTEHELIQWLCKFQEPTLKKILTQFLNQYYDKVTVEDNFLLAVGTIPVGVVAHLDTVFHFPPEQFFHDTNKNVFWSPEGAGFDDRAGVYAIIKLLQKGLRPTVIFTCGEEKGGIGAKELAARADLKPSLDFLIELDRQGANEAVYYQCGNTEFMNYIESFGFVHEIGTFSDISILCPAWKICGVNLSVGYVNEHTYGEHLYFDHLLATINKVTAILQATKYPTFAWKEHFQCDICGASCAEFELFPLKHNRFACPDCIAHRVSWCDKCKEAYPLFKGAARNRCPECKRGESNES